MKKTILTLVLVMAAAPVFAQSKSANSALEQLGTSAVTNAQIPPVASRMTPATLDEMLKMAVMVVATKANIVVDTAIESQEELYKSPMQMAYSLGAIVASVDQLKSVLMTATASYVCYVVDIEVLTEKALGLRGYMFPETTGKYVVTVGDKVGFMKQLVEVSKDLDKLGLDASKP